MSVSSFDSASVPHRLRNAAWREVDGETILLDTKGRVMRGLNATGGAAWGLADGKRSVAEIARAVAKSTGAPAEQVTADVLEFFNELRGLGVIGASDAG
jgi:hypothetical protein